MRDELGAFLGREVIDIRRLTTGHSRAMLVVTTADGERLVVRMEQGGVFGTSSDEEARIMSALHAAGYPVAEIVARDATGEVLGFPCFVMRFVEGDAPEGGERSLDDATAADFVSVLAHLHELDADATGLAFDLVPGTPDDATPAQIGRWYDVYRGAATRPVPLLEEARAWLLHHAPGLDRLRVVHGDAGPGNFVARGGRVVAVTDFEFCHLGDPAEDWVFCATMRGRTSRSREAWAALFAEIVGVELTPPAWHYWEAFNLFKGACANLTGLRVVVDGVRPAPNLLIVGTTLHQVFLRQLADLTASPPGSG